MDWIQGLFTAAMSKKLIPFMAIIGDKRAIDKNRLVDFLVMLAGVIVAIQIAVAKIETRLDAMEHRFNAELTRMESNISQMHRDLYKPMWTNSDAQRRDSH